MKLNNIISLLVLVAVAGAGIYYFMYRTTPTPMEETEKTVVSEAGGIVVIETEKGIIKAELRPDAAPKTVANFTNLVGKKFYDGLVFHRVVPGFVIQGGDPEGSGMGGSGTNIPLEIKCQDGTMTEGEEVTCPVALPHTDGALAMARSADPNSASSQFYITLGDQPALDGKYAVFGYVTEGKDIASLIEQGNAIKRIYLQK